MGTPQSSRSASYIEGAAFAPVPENLSDVHEGRGSSIPSDIFEAHPEDAGERRLLRAILKQAFNDLLPLPEGGMQRYKDQVKHPERQSKYFSQRPAEAEEIREAALEFFADESFDCWGGFSFEFICDRLGYNAPVLRAKIRLLVRGSAAEWERRKRQYTQDIK